MWKAISLSCGEAHPQDARMWHTKRVGGREKTNCYIFELWIQSCSHSHRSLLYEAIILFYSIPFYPIPFYSLLLWIQLGTCHLQSRETRLAQLPKIRSLSVLRGGGRTSTREDGGHCLAGSGWLEAARHGRNLPTGK